MKQQGLLYFTDTYLTTFGLIIFFTFFIVMFIWIMSKKRADYVNYMSQLPLQEDVHHEPR